MFLSRSNLTKKFISTSDRLRIGCANLPIASNCPASSYKPIVVIYGANAQ